MKAYFIHDLETGTDLFLVPANDLFFQADKQTMHQFISAQPDFSQWQGESLGGRTPESLGIMVASRDDDGDVCILEASLWPERMMSLLGSPS